MIGKSIGKIIGKDIVRYVGKVRLGANASPLPSYPAALDDGTTKGVYLFDEAGTITKDESDVVSLWADYLGGGNDLGDSIVLPMITAEGVVFANDTYLRKSIPDYNLPRMVYMVLRQDARTAEDVIFDGYVASGQLRQWYIDGQMKAYGNAYSADVITLPLTEFGIARMFINGVNSWAQINNETKITFDGGTTNPLGVILGAKANRTVGASVTIKAHIERNVDESLVDNTSIYNWLYLKYFGTLSNVSMTTFTPVTITQTGDIANANVQYQTGAAVIAALPTSINVTMEDASVVSIPITWADTDSYDPTTAADYTFTATWGTLPDGVDNNDSLVAPTTELTVTQGVVSYIIDESNQAWDQSTVDAYLVAAVDLGYVGYTIYVGGTNAAPSATGIAAINTLVSQGNSVYTS